MDYSNNRFAFRRQFLELWAVALCFYPQSVFEGFLAEIYKYNVNEKLKIKISLVLLISMFYSVNWRFDEENLTHAEES